VCVCVCERERERERERGLLNIKNASKRFGFAIVCSKPKNYCSSRV
jgi:hypothetical protein